MAFMIKGIIDRKGILFLMLLTVASQATNFDCNGKAFHCVNSTHFMICVDLGRGTSTTIDDVVIPCPSPTVCRRTNRFECEFPVNFIPSSTVATIELATTVITESEVTTFASSPTSTSVPYEEYFNTVSTTTLSQNELKPSPADTVLSVKPMTGGQDTSNLSTTEKVITEKSILNYVNAIPDTAVVSNFSNTVKPNNNNVSSDTLNQNVIPNDVVSANNSVITILQTQVTERSKFHYEYKNLSNEKNDVTSSGTEQKGKIENVFTTEFGPPLEYITKTVIMGPVTELPVKAPSTEISSAGAEQTMTNEQDFGNRFQNVDYASTIDTSTLVDNITLSVPTQNVSQIKDSQSVGDILKNAANFNNISEVFVNASSIIDVTSAVPEQIVNIAPDLAKSVQEATENAAVTDYFSTLSDKTTPLESALNVNKINASQSSSETIKYVTDNFSDMSVATTNSVLTVDYLDTRITESSKLNITQSTRGNESSPINTISELTGNSEPVLTNDFTESSVNSTETSIFNTISTDLTGAATEQTVTNEHVSTKVVEEPSNVAVTDNFAIVSDIVSTVGKPPADIINASQPVKGIIDDIGLASLFRTNETTTTMTNIAVTKNESDTHTKDILVVNNFENATTAVLASAETNTVSITDNPNHQEFYQTTASAHRLSDSSLAMTTEPAKVDNKVINASSSDNVAILDNTSTTDAVVTIENKISSKSIDQNHFNNRNIQTNQDDIVQGKVSDHGFSTTDSTVQDLVQKETSFTTRNNFESGSITVGTASVRTITEEPLDTELLKGSESPISSTIESDSATEIVTTISFNNLEMLITNTSTLTPTLGTSNEHINDSESDAESFLDAINNRMRNITDGLTINEKVLSTHDADSKPSTPAYNSNLSDKIKGSTISEFFYELSTSNLKLLPNEENTKIVIAVDTNELSGMNIHSESGNEAATESAILTSEAFLPKPAFNQSNDYTKDINEKIGETSTVPNDNISVAIIDEQAQTVTDRSTTAGHNVTDSSYIKSLSSVTEKYFLTDQYIRNVTATEITTLHSSTAIVDRNENSSEPITLQQTGTILMNTSTSGSTLPSTTMAINEAAYVPLDYTYAEKTSFHDEVITNTNYQTEIQTETVVLLTQTTESNNMFGENIDESAVKSDVILNIKGNAHESELLSLTTAKLNDYDINKQKPTTATQTFSDMPLRPDPTLKSITPSIIESITIKIALESITTADKNNDYISFTNDTLSNKALTTATDLIDSSTSNSDLALESITTADKNNAYISSTNDTLSSKALTTAAVLLDSSTSNSDLIQNHIYLVFTAAQGIENINITTDPSNISNNISSDVYSATVSPLTESTDSFTFNTDNVNETTMAASMTKSNLQKIKNPLENNLPTSNPHPKDHQPILPTTNTRTDVSLQSSTSRNYEAIDRSENIIKIATYVPAIEIIGNSTAQGTVVNDGRTTKTNLLENVVFNSSNSPIITYTQRDINTQSTTLVNIEETASAATTEIPMVKNTGNNQNITQHGDIFNEKLTEVHLKANNSMQQTNIENITLNISTLVESNRELHTALHQTFITTGEKNYETSTSAVALKSDQNIQTTPSTNSIIESSNTATVEIKLSSKAGPGLITSNLKKDDKQQFIDYSRAPIPILSPSSFAIPDTPPLQTTTLSTSDNSNTQKRLLTQTRGNLVPVNPNITNQFATKSIEKEDPSLARISQILVNNNSMDVKSPNVNETFTLSDPVNSNSIKPILSSVPSPIDLDISLKQRGTTKSGVRIDVLNLSSTQPISAVNTIAEKFLSQTEVLVSSVNSFQVSQTQPTIVAKSEISTAHEFFGVNHQLPIKTAGITNIEPTIVAVRRDLMTEDDSQTFIDSENTRMAVTFGAGQPTETMKRKANTNVEYIQSNTEKVMGSETTKEFTIQITVTGVKNIKDNNKSTSTANSSDFSVPTEVITTSDMLVDSKIESDKTHSGIISFITQSPKLREFKKKKEKPENEAEEEQEDPINPINVELASLQGLFTEVTVSPQKVNGNSVQKGIGTREELLVKNDTNDFKTTNENKSELRFSTKNNTSQNIYNGTNTAVSGYKKETPTHELIENSTPINVIHTSNNKSQDQNMSVPQVHNKPVISHDQRSTSRYMSQTKSTAAADTQTIEFSVSESTTRKTELYNFCKQKKRGRYADELDCRKFYICLGNKSSHLIEGTCPVKTVFSEINKQCTKNLSHCIRNNQFRCVTEGRFSDFLNDNIYYICVRNNLSHFIRFKLQCQNGYHLNKTSVRCVLNTESTSTGESKSASEQSSSSVIQDITEKPENKFKCKKTGVFPDPLNCKKYYECTKVDSSYRQKKKKCDSDEIFHKDKKKCVDGDSYEC